MVDVFMNFKVGCFFKSKNQDTITETVIQMWNGSGLGSPKLDLEYNGGVRE